MTRVARALVMHELLERTRDRWVIVISMLFALLSTGVTLYGQSAGADATKLTGPSLVTLASLLVPLVALVLSHDAIVGERERNTLGLLLSLPVGRIEVVFAKYIGRALALVFAVVAGLGVAVVVGGSEQAQTLSKLVGPTLLLGLSFLALGMLISSLVERQVTAASAVVVVWFLLVFFYDLGLLGLLVITDGAVGQDTVAMLVASNPAGLYRVEMMHALAGPEVLTGLGMTASLPSQAASAGIWAGWLLGPVVVSGLLLKYRKVV